MKGIMLKDWEWVAKLEYLNGNETELHFDSMQALDMLSAIAHVYRHIGDFPHTEVVSLKQVRKIVKQTSEIESNIPRHIKTIVVERGTKKELDRIENK